MGEGIAKQELFEYRERPGIHIYLIPSDAKSKRLASHWHDELEIVYTVRGRNRHFINGEAFECIPGRLLVVNSNFVHYIEPARQKDESARYLAAIVVILSREFLDLNFPEYREIYFTNDKLSASPEIDQVMLRLLWYADGFDTEPYGSLRRRALILELLYLMCGEGVVKRTIAARQSSQKDAEQIKGVVDYVEKHYAEPLSRETMANRLCLSTNYFSSYFKKYMGITFTKYLEEYRLIQAHTRILESEDSIGRIAMECGFTDDRRLIIAFKNRYGDTPLQYRKKVRRNRQV